MSKSIQFQDRIDKTTMLVLDDPDDLAYPNDLVINYPKIVIHYDYPLDIDAEFPYRNPSGFTRLSLFMCILDGYQTIYEHPEKYGVWGHGLDDLFLEGAVVNGDQVELQIGS